MSQIKKLLGKRIKEIRISRNLTQEGLSELTNIGVSSISKIESGIYHPTDENLEKIAKALCVEPYKLYMYNHNDNISNIRTKVISIVENADEKNLKLIYRILTSIID